MNTESSALDTPMMRQYLELKKKYEGAILLFRMGDFYELFTEDAILAAPIMEVALTKRQNNIPMAGIPYHSADTYIQKLLNAGHKVAIAEQIVDPNNAKLMQRRVVRVLTHGTLVEEKFLPQPEHNYIMSMISNFETYAFALADVSTGDFISFEVKSIISKDKLNPREMKGALEKECVQMFYDQSARFKPREVLVTVDTYNTLKQLPEKKDFVIIEDWKASPTEGRNLIHIKYSQSLKGLGYLNEWSLSLGAVGMLLHYINDHFPSEQGFLLHAPVYRSFEEEYLSLDEQSIANLDLVYNQREGNQNRTLYSVLNTCETSAGRRLLKENIVLPLKNKAKILARQSFIEQLNQEKSISNEIRSHLKEIHDLERILARISGGKGAPRDILATCSTIRVSFQLSEILKNIKSSYLKIEVPETLLSLARRIENEITSEPPAVLPGTSPFVREGCHQGLDKARQAEREGGEWILDFERQERERTGLSSLRVKFHKFSGYFIEVSRVQAKSMPEEYYRKQTLTNYERFSSPRLVELETILGNAEETIHKIEAEYFQDLLREILSLSVPIKRIMQELAELDFLLSLAFIAAKKKWTKPIFEDGMVMHLEESRHPIVEEYMDLGEQFVSNDIHLNKEKNLALLTGPNMAGKSTYIRQAGLIQILAQMGSYVPAKKAVMSVCEQIFTRIGSGDNLTRGESTFFTEMLESARILNQAGPRALVIMDEVGRGTSTSDGLALAWAMVEFLSASLGPRPLVFFATHYHELTQLGGLDSHYGIYNLTMEVLEEGGNVVFLHKVRKGVASHSYGIYVAKLAGLPERVIHRAQEILMKQGLKKQGRTNEKIEDGGEGLLF